MEKKGGGHDPVRTDPLADRPHRRTLPKRSRVSGSVLARGPDPLLGDGVLPGVEGWTLLDAFYFSAVTLTTVGYGDLSPSTALSTIFTVVYLFVEIGLILGLVDTVSKCTLEKRCDRRAGTGNHAARSVMGTRDPDGSHPGEFLE